MKNAIRLLLPLFLFAACASHKAPPAPPPSPTIAPADPGSVEVGVPLNPETLREMETLRNEGMERLYSKDPAVRNPKLAFEKLMHAAQLGDPVAMDHVGNFYVSGEAGVEKSCPKAIEWFEKAAKLGYPMSLNNLAYTLLSCPDKQYRDPGKAEDLMKVLFANTPGLLAALDTYAAVLAEGNDFPQAVKTMEVVIDLADFVQANPQQVDDFKDTLERYRARKTVWASEPAKKGAPKKPRGKAKAPKKGT